MSIALSVHDLLQAGLSHPLFLPAVIILATFILEDATTILVGVWASTGSLSPEVALLSLYIGIVLGDFGLYASGRLAAKPRWGARVASHDRLAPFRAWLERRLVLATFTVRFLPGLRLPAYTATGFFGMPFRRFALTVMLATAIWTTGLFAAAYFFGAATAGVLGNWRWPICLIPVAGLILLGRWSRRKVARAHARS
ncbi:MAG TPA: VTT domain-containing protein [Dongiaceae bacterium]|nr:VTT domain-containing protein [Dongiaceae bacterium]